MINNFPSSESSPSAKEASTSREKRALESLPTGRNPLRGRHQSFDSNPPHVPIVVSLTPILLAMCVPTARLTQQGPGSAEPWGPRDNPTARARTGEEDRAVGAPNATLGPASPG